MSRWRDGLGWLGKMMEMVIGKVIVRMDKRTRVV